MDNEPLSSLIGQLVGERRVWVRFAAHRPPQEWQLAVLEVTTGEPPPQWRRRRWRYPRAVFVASAPAGKTVAGWLARGRVRLPAGSTKLALHDSCSVERRDANADGIFEPPRWPAIQWSLNAYDPSAQSPPHDELVATGSPAFFSFDQAALAFFAVEHIRNRNFSGREIVVRQQDRRARIDSVLVEPARVVVRVSGNGLRGTALTLSGADGATRALSARSRDVRLPTLTGLPSGAWLALHRDAELVDRRFLDPTWGSRSDVNVEVDAATRLQTLISGGERAIIEYKRQLPAKDARGVMKTVAAFANGDGGILVFGVEDDAHVVGLADEWNRQSLDRLTATVSDWVRPLPDFNVELVEIDGRGVIALQVVAGIHAPYGVGTSDRDARYYARRGATTFPASPADVRAFVQARAAR